MAVELRWRSIGISKAVELTPLAATGIKVAPATRTGGGGICHRNGRGLGQWRADSANGPNERPNRYWEKAREEVDLLARLLLGRVRH